MFIDKYKIRTRLNIGIVMLFLYALLISVIAIVEVKKTNVNSNFMFEHPFIVSNNVRDININVYQIHNLSHNLFLSFSTNHFDSTLLQFAFLNKRIHSCFDTIFSRFLGDNNLVTKVFNGYIDWYSSELQMIQTYKNKMNVSLGEEYKIINEHNLSNLLLQTKQISDFAYHKANEFHLATEKSEKRNLFMFTTVIIILLVFGSIFSFIISRSIVKPLVKVIGDLKIILNQENSQKEINENFNSNEFSQINEIELIESSITELKNTYLHLNNEIEEREQIEQKIEEQYEEIQQINNQLSTANIELEQRIVERTKELSLSEERYRTLFDNVGEGIGFVNNEEQFIYINQKGESIFGVSSGEMVGRNLKEFLSPEEISLVQLQTEMRKNGHTGVFETQIIRTDNSKRNILITAVPQFDKQNQFVGTLGVFRDITDRKRIEEGQKNLKQAVETSGEIIFMTDKSGLFTYINPAFTTIYGYTEDEIIGKCTPRILKSGKLSEVTYERFWKTILNREVVHNEPVNRTKDGKLLIMESSSNPIVDNKGDIIGFLAIQRDISERKQIEKELIKSKEKAEESDRFKTAFLANMSHEIRTPLNGIIGFSEMLVRPELTEAKKNNYVDIIKECSTQLMTIINDLIDIAKIESNQISIIEKEININGLLKDLHSLYQSKVAENSLELLIQLGANDTESEFITDGVRLKQILINLIDNALKFTHNGHIRFGYKIKKYFIEFFVEDTGIGIDKTQQELIFKPFKQIESGLSRNYGGTGLGLSISKALVQLLGGNIWLESEPGTGTTFYLNIPCKSEFSNIKIAKNTYISEYVNYNNKTVLVAEDEELIFLYLEEVLSDMGINTIWAKNGREAIEFVSQNPAINLVLMDIKMPEINGYDAIVEIKKINKNLPIIVQTAYAQIGDREKAIECGCDEYIPKPLNNALLNKLISKYLKEEII